MSDVILVLNAGSSSLKYAAFAAGGAGASLARGKVDSLSGDDAHARALEQVFGRLRAEVAGHRLAAVGHRVVHGGSHFAAPIRIDDAVLAELDATVPLAPLHQPHSLAAVRAARALAPGVPQVACFDTAFHGAQPEVAQRFGLPRRFTDAGVRRYGFHGLSYESIAAALPGLDARAAAGRAVVAHLGNGASMCALRAGRSAATTMSFTPADGLVMGTRCGSLDPGALLYLMRAHGLTADAAEHLLNHESGLLGVSGVSGDMRELLASPDPRAAEAVELFVYRIARELGSLAAALGGLDALVFTGGIGENAPAVRAAVCRSAAWLGVELDAAANDAGGPRISTAAGAVSVWVVATDEERVIADHTRRVLGPAAASG